MTHIPLSQQVRGIALCLASSFVLGGVSSLALTPASQARIHTYDFSDIHSLDELATYAINWKSAHGDQIPHDLATAYIDRTDELIRAQPTTPEQDEAMRAHMYEIIGYAYLDLDKNTPAPSGRDADVLEAGQRPLYRENEHYFVHYCSDNVQDIRLIAGLGNLSDFNETRPAKTELCNLIENIATPNEKPVILPHRGFWGVPFLTGPAENTEGALHQALQYNFKAIEIDVSFVDRPSTSISDAKPDNLMLNHYFRMHAFGGDKTKSPYEYSLATLTESPSTQFRARSRWGATL